MDGWDVYQPEAEYTRQGLFNPKSKYGPLWRLWNNFSTIEGESLCSTYPSILAVPARELVSDVQVH
jgi:hypothetical protein